MITVYDCQRGEARLRRVLHDKNKSCIDDLFRVFVFQFVPVCFPNLHAVVGVCHRDGHGMWMMSMASKRIHGTAHGTSSFLRHRLCTSRCAKWIWMCPFPPLSSKTARDWCSSRRRQDFVKGFNRVRRVVGVQDAAHLALVALSHRSERMRVSVHVLLHWMRMHWRWGRAHCAHWRLRMLDGVHEWGRRRS